MNPVIAILSAILFGFALLVLPPFLASHLVRRFGGGPRHAGLPTPPLSCPRCRAASVARLPANRVTPFPGYECGSCDLRMRPPNTGRFYALILVLSVAVFAAVAAMLCLEGEADLHWGYVAVVVGAYCILQLRRPTPIQ